MALNEPTISSNGVVRPTYIEVNLTRLMENYPAIERAVAPATEAQAKRTFSAWLF